MSLKYLKRLIEINRMFQTKFTLKLLIYLKFYWSLF
jgi:hypothetical protein